ncbi:hypothetical protein Lal_00047630 [Lupinus albus]|uniref:Putative IQ motif, EF-hand binding protein n=1 Tax=Lupinus albus TaxID=3870 RepID=A0A6A5N3V2_LUPAL|nr:putative IQ motif, EF-hand binding protein [Lupinus albus]KAF1878958.1 hypothetical protein Lal_00047630 [Lupinus albus]
MGKTGKWFRNLLKRKKEKKEKDESATNLNCSSNGTENPTIPISKTPKEKGRQSIRRSPTPRGSLTNLVESSQNQHTMAHASAAAVIRFGSSTNATTIQEAAAIKIQSIFRSHLARKALCALRGLVKLQALVKGHLVRKQAKATLRSMQALVTAQARARAQRIRNVLERKQDQKQSTYTNTSEDDLFRHMHDEMDRSLEDKIKIVEMDVCESKGNSRSSITNAYHQDQYEHRFSTYYSNNSPHSKEENYKVSPAPSDLTGLSAIACSGHFEECFSTAQSSPQGQYYAVSKDNEDSMHPFAFPKPPYTESIMSYDHPVFPKYMANTESSRAKVRSQSAPKQRPDSFERQLSRRRFSLEGRNVPRPVRMQRSSSHVSVTAHNYKDPCSIKLNKSTVSLKDSECGSTSTVITTNTNHCTSFVAYDSHGVRY